MRREQDHRQVLLDVKKIRPIDPSIAAWNGGGLPTLNLDLSVKDVFSSIDSTWEKIFKSLLRKNEDHKDDIPDIFLKLLNASIRGYQIWKKLSVNYMSSP